MATRFWKEECDEHGIGGSGEHYGDNDAHLGRVIVFYHEAKATSTRPARCFATSSRRDRRCKTKSPLGELFSPDNLVDHTRGQKLGQRPLQKG
jgi:hypothetical protein